MKSNLKKLMVLAFVVVFCFSFVVGCQPNNNQDNTQNEQNQENAANNENQNENNTNDDSEENENTNNDQNSSENNGQTSDDTNNEVEDESAIDLSEHVTLKMILLGDVPPDKEVVYDRLNEMVEEDLNASLEVEFLPWSDYTQKYPLILASGEDVDIIYTSSWAFYNQEANKGAFMEITDEVVKKYMPLTWERQDEVSFEQGEIDGKCYYVPNNLTGVGESAVVIRGDLRESYGLGELESIEDLETFYEKVVENEDGIFPYAAAQNNDSMKALVYYQTNKLVQINGLINKYGYRFDDDPVDASSVEFLYEMPEYKEFAEEMKSWADKGFWSKNAIANQTQPRDAFENGTSASLVWNLGTLGNTARTVLGDNPDWDPEIYDVTPDAVHTMGLYSEGMAVVDSSDNKARALRLIDLLKFDREYYETIRYGIEGKHWIAVGEDKWEPGPDQEEYVWGAYGTWGLKNREFERERIDIIPEEEAIGNRWEEEALNTDDIFQGFIFDDSNVKNEMAALNNTISKYGMLLDLGLVEDVESTWNEFMEEAETAGKDKIDAELQKQLEAYLEK